MRVPACAVLLIGLATTRPGYGQLDPAVVQMLQPDVRFLLGVEWRRTFGTAVGDQIQKRIAQAGLPAVPEWTAMEKFFREDLDSLILASSARDMSPKPGQQTPMLAIVKGRFNRPELRQWIQGKTEVYRRAELIAPRNTTPATTRIALLDDSTILFGDRKELVGALDRLAAPPPERLGNRLVGRAGDLSGQYDLWLAVEGLDAPAQKDKNPYAQMLSQVNGFEMGMSFAQGLDMQARLRAKTDEAARSLAQMIQGFVAMAAIQEGQTAETAEMLRKIQIAHAPRAVTMSLSLTPAEIQKALRQAEAMQHSPRAGRATAPAAAQPQPAPARPEGPRRIRILGADGGPKEVPVGPEQKPQ